MTDMEYIRNRLSIITRLDQLVEEMAELTQAICKFKRSLDNQNPTPVTCEEAYDNVLLELADVLNSVNALGLDEEEFRKILSVMESKEERWAERLRNC